jgi:hypothetical protein
VAFAAVRMAAASFPFPGRQDVGTPSFHADFELLLKKGKIPIAKDLDPRLVFHGNPKRRARHDLRGKNTELEANVSHGKSRCQEDYVRRSRPHPGSIPAYGFSKQRALVMKEMG